MKVCNLQNEWQTEISEQLKLDFDDLEEDIDFDSCNVIKTEEEVCFFFIHNFSVILTFQSSVFSDAFVELFLLNTLFVGFNVFRNFFPQNSDFAEGFKKKIRIYGLTNLISCSGL